MRVLAFLLLGAAAVAAVAAVNFALLGYGGSSDDPVGRLTPRAVELMARPGGQAVRPPVTPSGDDGVGDPTGDEQSDRDDDDD